MIKLRILGVLALVVVAPLNAQSRLASTPSGATVREVSAVFISMADPSPSLSSGQPREG